MSLPLIVLRPQPAAQESLARAQAYGAMARAMPLFEIEPLPWTPPPGSFDGLVLTSANAPRHAGAGLARYAQLPAHCVGTATASAARDAGLTVARCGTGGAQALLDALPPGFYLWLGGEERTGVAVPAAVQLSVVAVYRAVPAPIAGHDLAGPAVVLVHSARAARRLGELAPYRGRLHVVAISEGVAAACGAGWATLVVPARPDDAAMVEIGTKLCQER